MSLSPDQCRAARALVGLSQVDLATAAEVSVKTLADFERGVRQPYGRTRSDIREALVRMGIVFLDPMALMTGAHGVRLRMPLAGDHVRLRPGTSHAAKFDGSVAHGDVYVVREVHVAGWPTKPLTVTLSWGESVMLPGVPVDEIEYVEESGSPTC